MKISHEVPLAYLESSKKFNDYDYALIHLFDKYPEYAKFYKDSIKDGREVILDNSAYEINVTPELKKKYPDGYYDMRKYQEWINWLNPTYYILPDSKANVEKTIKLAYEFINNYPCKGKTIGVVHGDSIEEMRDCYKEMLKIADKIAFSFEKWMIDEYRGEERTVRYRVLERIGIDESVPHHLLGCINPLEFIEFKGCDWIESIDTSAPITHALQGEILNVNNAYQKPKITIHSEFERGFDVKLLTLMRYNAKTFKEWIKQ